MEDKIMPVKYVFVTGGVVLVAVTVDAIKESPVMRERFAHIFKRK